MKMLPLLLLSALFAAGPCAPAEDKPLYSQDFDALKEMPEDIMQLNGEFTVVAEGSGKAMALTPTPLDTYNCLFGPPAKDGIAARARIQGAAKGRQSPSFGIGLERGERFRPAPGHRQGPDRAGPRRGGDHQPALCLEIRDLDALPAPGPRAHPRQCSGGRGQGLARDGEAEPAGWTLTSTHRQGAPSAGRPSLWGVPYGGKPILFDDLVVAPVAGK